MKTRREDAGKYLAVVSWRGDAFEGRGQTRRDAHMQAMLVLWSYLMICGGRNE